MSAPSIRKIFPKRLLHYMSEYGKTRNDLVRDLGFKYSTIRDWEKGLTVPRMDKVELLAKYFNCNNSDLLEEKLTEEKEKDNDILADIIVRMRMDEDFFSVVESLYNLDSAKINGVQEMLNAFVK